ncbi:hypothetical protein NLJ89_g11891 [Agrocybe chaxingu]|uniref:Uncharacterized protein n=1 Tax=Agrocybe chaxingu TaxID=84603 RepID=A0A9W8MPL2_9AGAR|nr:hypothetical protein NLJ89_g11891 [Agrocybe chaxingu]
MACLVPAGCSDDIPLRDYYPVAESMLRAILPRHTPRSSHTRKTESSKRKEKLPVAARQTPPASAAASSKPAGLKRKARERQDSIETIHQEAPVEEVKRRRLAPPIALPPSSTIHVKHRAEVVVPRRPPPTPRSQPTPPLHVPTPTSDTDFIPPKIKTPPPSQIETRHSTRKPAPAKTPSSPPEMKPSAKSSAAPPRNPGAAGRGRGRGGKAATSSLWVIPPGGLATNDNISTTPAPLDGQELLDSISEHPDHVVIPRPCGNCIQRGKAKDCRFMGSNKPCQPCASRKSGHCTFAMGTLGHMRENEASVLHHRLSVSNLRRLIRLHERDLAMAYSLRRQVKSLYESAEACSLEILGILFELMEHEPISDFGRAYLTDPALEEDLRVRLSSLFAAEAASIENDAETTLHSLEQVLPHSTVPGAPDPFASTLNAGPSLQESQDVAAVLLEEDEGEQSPEEGS